MSEKPDENRPLQDDQIVIATELHLLSEKPKAAKLILHTLEGSQAFGINGDIAEGLVDMLERFLGNRAP